MLSRPVFAGPILLNGGDPDDHNQATIYIPLFQNMLDNVTNGGSGILALGVKDEDSPTNEAGDFITTIAAGLNPVQTVTFKSGANIDTVSFTGYAMIHVPTNSGDCPLASCGGLTDADNEKIVARVSDVTTFVNGGGGFSALSQSFLTHPYGMVIGSCGETLTIKKAATAGSLFTGFTDNLDPEQYFYNISPTAEGLTFGITETNLDGFFTGSLTCNNCWHNVFTAYPSFFHLIATCVSTSAPGAAYNGQAAIIGGTNNGICPSNSGDWAWTHRP